LSFDLAAYISFNGNQQRLPISAGAVIEAFECGVNRTGRHVAGEALLDYVTGWFLLHAVTR
jgi:hypothetical protein